MISVPDTEIINKPNALHKLFTKLNKYIILTCALLIWIIVPIVGIPLILLYCQINISSYLIKGRNKPFINIIPLLLVIFTISTYIASFQPYSDTEVYISIYNSLKYEPIFTFPDSGMEPLTFLLPKYLSILTDGNELSFLFLQSITINTALTVFTRIFEPEFYPLIILINIMSQGYYFQLFWMRQFYSFIFVIPAIYMDTYIVSLMFIFLGYYTHRSSLIYSIPLVIAFFKSFIAQMLNPLLNLFKIPKIKFNFWIVTFILLLTVFSGQLMKILIDVVTSSPLVPSGLSERIAIYAGDSSATFNQEVFTIRNQIRTIFDYIIILVFVTNADYKKVNPRYFRLLFSFITIFILYIGSFIFGFSLRISSIFFCLPGFFYMLTLHSKKMDKDINIYSYLLIIMIILRILYFIASLLVSYDSNNDDYLVFWNGETLTTPINSYFNLLVKALASLFN